MQSYEYFQAGAAHAGLHPVELKDGDDGICAIKAMIDQAQYATDAQAIEPAAVGTYGDKDTDPTHGKYPKNSIGYYKADAAPFAIFGDIQQRDDGSYHRGNKDLLRRSLLMIDADNIEFGTLVNKMRVAMPYVRWLVYPSINSGVPANTAGGEGHEAIKDGKYYGFRVVISTDHSWPKVNHKPLYLGVMDKLGFKADDHTDTWSQIQGLPVVTKYNNLKAESYFNDGSPLVTGTYIVFGQELAPVTKPVSAPSKRVSAIQKPHVDDNTAIALLESYTERHSDDFEDEQFFTSRIRFLVESEAEGEISSDVVDGAGSIFSMGKSEWMDSNPTKINDQRKQALAPNELTFTQFFGTTKDQQYSTTKSLIEVATGKAKNWLELFHAKDEKDKSKLLPAKSLAKVIYETFPCFRYREDNAAASRGTMVYLYDPSQGIYDASYSYLAHVVFKIDDGCSKSIGRTRKQVDEVLFQLQQLAPREDIETSKELVALGNGVYDIRKNLLYPFSPKYHFISKIAAPFGGYAEPRVELADGTWWTPTAWIKSLAAGNEGIEDLLWYVIADCAEPNWSHNKANILVGSGANGKSTFVNMLSAMIGSANIANLTIDKMDERFQAVALIGKAVMFSDDLAADAYLPKSSIFNTAVTGGIIRSEIKGQDQVTFPWHGTIVQPTNEVPTFANKSDGTYTRLNIIPFNAKFGRDSHPELQQVVVRNDVVQWILYHALTTHGNFACYPQVDAVTDEVNDFKRDNDSVLSFLDETMCNYDSARLPIKWLYKQYTQWCDETGFKHPLSRPAFIKRVLAPKDVKIKDLSSVDKTKPLHEALPIDQIEAVQKNVKADQGSINYFLDMTMADRFIGDTPVSGAADADTKQRCVCFPLREQLLEEKEDK